MALAECLRRVAWGAAHTVTPPPCWVPIQPLTPEQRARLDEAIDQAVPEGGMPLFLGWTLGVNQLADLRATNARYSDAVSYDVLVVDGVPTVNRDGVTPGSGLNWHRQ